MGYWANTAQTDHVTLRPWPLTLEVMVPVADAGRPPQYGYRVWSSSALPFGRYGARCMSALVGLVTLTFDRLTLSGWLAEISANLQENGSALEVTRLCAIQIHVYLLTYLKLVCESHLMWGTFQSFLPILARWAFGFSNYSLRTRRTDRQTETVRSPLPNFTFFRGNVSPCRAKNSFLDQ